MRVTFKAQKKPMNMETRWKINKKNPEILCDQHSFFYGYFVKLIINKIKKNNTFQTN